MQEVRSLFILGLPRHALVHRWDGLCGLPDVGRWVVADADPWAYVGQQYRRREIPTRSRYSEMAGIQPDPWQAKVLDTDAPRIILLCSRQSGKSTTIGTLAMHTAEYEPGSLTIIGSPSQNQSAELLRKGKDAHDVVGTITEDQETIANDSVLRFELKNRSRIICVPGKNGTVRGYSGARTIIVDEAAYVMQDFYAAVMPMIAVSKGRIILLSTAYAKFGMFYNTWTKAPDYDPAIPVEEQPDAWLKIMVPWWDCPRITQATVDEYRETFGEIAYQREFCCQFTDSEFAAFTEDEIKGMSNDELTWWDDL